MKPTWIWLELILGLGVVFSLAQAPGKRGILRPADKSILSSGQLSIIARASGDSKLHLDGEPLVATEPAPRVLTVKVTPSPGLHELVLTDQDGEQKLQFFVQAPETPRAPQGWKAFEAHPPEDSCETCHARRAGTWSFKGAALAENCFGCHDQKIFPEAHTHNDEVLAECQLCHDPHGSTEKFLLMMPRPIACKQCHG